MGKTVKDGLSVKDRVAIIRLAREIRMLQAISTLERLDERYTPSKGHYDSNSLESDVECPPTSRCPLSAPVTERNISVEVL